ncbi:putative NAD -binding domain protein [Rosellinia necatrix]|uniref:Putative NAD-binding domain protein n=1 Tax=Rosellinia necatrix TaxID=77044 RepID=A0A1S8A559_ROSNE|nr:putative NAD -binding domain protein [Rosellinia necatrix]
MAATKGSILVTGANGGLGSAIAEHIAREPELSTYHGFYTVRDATSAPALASALAHGGSTHPHEHDVVSLDLTRLDNVRQVANHVNVRRYPQTITAINTLTVS